LADSILQKDENDFRLKFEKNKMAGIPQTWRHLLTCGKKKYIRF